LSNPNHATPDAGPGVAYGLGEFVYACVDDYASAQDCVLAGDGGGGQDYFDMGVAFVVGFDVAHIADVAHGFAGFAVLVALGVKVAAGAHGFRIGAIAELMDMEAMFGIGGEAVDVCGDFYAVAGVGEFDDAHNLFIAGCAVDYGDGFLYFSADFGGADDG